MKIGLLFRKKKKPELLLDYQEGIEIVNRLDTLARGVHQGKRSEDTVPLAHEIWSIQEDLVIFINKIPAQEQA